MALRLAALWLSFIATASRAAGSSGSCATAEQDDCAHGEKDETGLLQNKAQVAAAERHQHAHVGHAEELNASQATGDSTLASYIQQCMKNPATEEHIQLIGMGQSRNSYQSDRAGLHYYRHLFCSAQYYGKGAGKVLDVGSSNPPFLLSMNWVRQRDVVAPYLVGDGQCDGKELCDLGNGITSRMADFMKWDPDTSDKHKPYDLVICSQVVEHVDDPTAFVRKLVGTAETLIMSVPYKWHDENCGHCHHKSHNIDEDRIRNWAGQRELAHYISKEDGGEQRIIMVFRK